MESMSEWICPECQKKVKEITFQDLSDMGGVPMCSDCDLLMEFTEEMTEE